MHSKLIQETAVGQNRKFRSILHRAQGSRMKSQSTSDAFATEQCPEVEQLACL